MDSKVLAEDHKLRVEENLSSILHFIMTYTLYSIRRNQNDDHTEYDVSRSNDMKDMANILGDAKEKPREQGTYFAPTYEFSLVQCSCFR